MSIQDLYKQFPDVHPNIILKSDILRLGIDISKSAAENFKQRDDLLWKGFHLFSYDFKKTALYSEKVPWLFHLEDGCNVQVRTNDETPYLIDLVDGEFVIKEGPEIVARKIWFERKPRYYDMRTEKGTQLAAIAQGTCRFMFVTMNKYCELKNSGDECLFCDFNATTKDQATGGEDLLARGDAETIAEAILTAFEAEHHMSWLWLSGGTIISRFRGETELDFYCSRLNIIREKLQVWIPSVLQIRAQDDNGWKRIHETGVSTVQPNIEVWGKDLFAWICPASTNISGGTNGLEELSRQLISGDAAGLIPTLFSGLKWPDLMDLRMLNRLLVRQLQVGISSWRMACCRDWPPGSSNRVQPSVSKSSRYLLWNISSKLIRPIRSCAGNIILIRHGRGATVSIPWHIIVSATLNIITAPDLYQRVIWTPDWA